MLEGDLDRTEEKLSKTLQHLEISEKARDDAECHLRSLENAEQTNFDRLDQQEQQLKLAKSSANDSDRKYEGNYSENSRNSKLSSNEICLS